MRRIDGRAADEIRPVRIVPHFLEHPMGSVLIECGKTRVICSVSCENKVPGWMKNQGKPGGWLTCEYGMLPGSTGDRIRREISAGKPNSRGVEIQRLIGRSLRAVADLEKLGENTLYCDCDVIDADGGTRCASITGAATALMAAMRSAAGRELFPVSFMKESVAAISVGIVDGEPLLDLCYEEDSRAEVDMNVVMTSSGRIVEIQGTAERMPFDRKQLNLLLDLAETGIGKLLTAQKEAWER